MSYNINTSIRYDKASESTAENIREMEELLPPILRNHGAVNAKDGDSIDMLDSVHFMGLVCRCVN